MVPPFGVPENHRLSARREANAARQIVLWARLAAPALALVVLSMSYAVHQGAAANDGWRSYLAAVDRAIRGRDINQAMRSWRDAYAAALGTRQWEPMLAVGQAALEIGAVAGINAGFDAKAKARRCYLSALFGARQHGDLDGVLLATGAFAQLDDVEVVRSAIRIADGMAERARDGGAARARVAAFRKWLKRRSPARSYDLDPLLLLFPDAMAGP